MMSHRSTRPFPGLTRWTAILAVAMLLLSALPIRAGAKVQVVTTTTDLADIARNIGGNLVDVQSIARGYQDPHQVDARPSYILMLRKADLFVQMGLDLEVAWVPSLLDGSRNANIARGGRGFVDASAGVPVLRDFGPIDRSMGDVHPQGNPHYHLDPANAKIIARNITEGLKRVDPGHAATYEANLVTWVKKLSQASRRWATLAASLRGKKIVTYHNSWPYFARRFGLVVIDHVEPKAGIAPSAAHIAKLVQTMKAQNVKVIVMEPYFSQQVPQTVARETGGRVVVLPPMTGGEAGTDTYLDLITHDLEKLAAALKG